MEKEMLISSISVSPNRDIVTAEILRSYLDIVRPYLDISCNRYVCALEKGKREFENHIQIVCESEYSAKSLKQHLDRTLDHLPGYYKGARGKKDGSTVCAVNRTDKGTSMFGYPLKERPVNLFVKGITTSELEQFRVAFAQLPDYKDRRPSVKTVGVGDLINLLWKKMVYYEVKSTYNINTTNVERINKYLKSHYNIIQYQQKDFSHPVYSRTNATSTEKEEYASEIRSECSYISEGNSSCDFDGETDGMSSSSS